MTNNNDLESLAATFHLHAEEEGKILAEYRKLAEKLGDSTVGFLVDHILTEEEMHHFLLRTMAKWLRERSAKLEGALPPDADRAELLRLTQDLRRHEEETIATCRDLQSRLPKEHRILLGIMLDVVVLDSEKHHRLLRAVEKMIEA